MSTVKQAGGGVSIQSARHTDETAAPKKVPDNWFNKSPEKDGVEGMSVDAAYDRFDIPTRPTGKPIIVAVIDSGGDITHEDLRGPLGPSGEPLDPANDRIWVNVKDLKDGLDNDGNGLVDDTHGWAFIGNSNDTSLEVAREELRLRELEKRGPLTPKEQVYREAVRRVLNRAPDPQRLLDDAVAGAKSRQETVGDDVNDYSQKHYGNNDVFGKRARHGTHVSGSIGADRLNAEGIMGVASNVKIIQIRILGEGDEYDKDVAQALRYAADAGAEVVNMSFGKEFSPGRRYVEDAALYAASRDVLMFHAAGNDGKNLDGVDGQFRAPTRNVERAPNAQVPGWAEVGASGPFADATLAARFSNYGKNSVDFFAPGVGIRGPVPTGDDYDTLSGTSMASPSAAGVGAVIRDLFPALTADEVLRIMKASVRTYPGLMVNRPGKTAGSPEQVPFSELSQTGGIVDLLQAIELASEVTATRGGVYGSL